MKKPKSYSFILSVGKNNLIPSVNSLYKAKVTYVRGKPVAQIYKDTSAKGVITKLSDQLREINFREVAPWIYEKDAIFDLQAQAIFKQSFFRRDADNLLKLLQDTIFRHLGLNDSRVITVQMSKVYCPGISEEKICFNLSQSTTQIDFGKLEELPEPEKIFLQGASEGLPEEILERISEDPGECDCHLYLITPETDELGYLLSEALGEAYQVQESGLGAIIVGVLPGEYSVETQKTLDLIRGVSGGTKKITVTNINSPEEILGSFQIKKKKKRK